MRPIPTVVAIFLLAAAGGVVPRAADDASVTPFAIRVPDADLADLKARLARARFPDEIPGTEWTYGTSRAYLESLVHYWRDGFDWRRPWPTAPGRPERLADRACLRPG